MASLMRTARCCQYTQSAIARRWSAGIECGLRAVQCQFLGMIGVLDECGQMRAGALRVVSISGLATSNHNVADSSAGGSRSAGAGGSNSLRPKSLTAESC